MLDSLFGDSHFFELRDDGRVRLRVTLSLSAPRDEVWEHMRHFGTFVTRDPLHQEVIPNLTDAKPGTPFILRHGWGPFRVDRAGRILEWTDGRGYTFSDISLRGMTTGFPHVLVYRLEDRDEGSILSVEVRGKWTLSWVPRLLVLGWLRGVMAGMVIQLRQPRAALGRGDRRSS